MSAIWVTGATGFTGSYLIDFLQNIVGVSSVIGLGRSTPESARTAAFYSVDLTAPGVVSGIAEESPPSLVFHLAGLAPPADEAEMWHLNVGGTIQLLHGLAAAGCDGCTVVCAGSAAEYRSGSTRRLDEKSPCGGAAPYGFSKWAQTCAALSLGRELGIKIMVARPFNLVGPGLPERLVAGAICAQFADPDTRQVRVGNVQSERDFIDIRDAVAAYWKIAEHGRDGEIYNVCSGRATSIATLLTLFSKFAAHEKEIIHDAVRVKNVDLDCVYGSNEKLNRASGWLPRIPLAQSVSDMLEAVS